MFEKACALSFLTQSDNIYLSHSNLGDWKCPENPF